MSYIIIKCIPNQEVIHALNLAVDTNNLFTKRIEFQMKKIKITFLINSLTAGGAERVLTTLANNLIASYDVSIITFYNDPPFYNLDSRIKLISCYDEYKPSLNPIEAIKSNRFLFKKINSIVKANNINLIISFMTTANVLGTFIGKLNKIPVIISERTNPYHQELPKVWRLLRSISYRYSDMLIVQTETISKFFDGKIDKNKLRILPNPISSELTKNRFIANNSKNKNIILSVGRLIPSKAHDMLIKAFALTNHNDWELWIAGDGPELSYLQKLIQDHQINDHVKLLGQVKEVFSLYNVSKIFAFSSTYEGFPNALIEAMHFGLACVSTDCPTGPAELIKDGENGYLIPINDIDAMRNKLSYLMENQSKIDEFGRKSMLAVQQYEEDHVMAKWNDIIKKLV